MRYSREAFRLTLQKVLIVAVVEDLKDLDDDGNWLSKEARHIEDLRVEDEWYADDSKWEEVK